MSLLISKHAKYSRFTIVLFLGALFVAGCSGSSDSLTSPEIDALDTDTINVVADDETTTGTGDIINSPTDSATDDATNDETVINDIASDLENDVVATIPEDTTVTEPSNTGELELPDNSNPVVVDPLIQNRIFVIFEITVPAYQSSELRLEVVWGDLNITAAWVGDEFWTVSSELPTETEELLTVTFFDNNGAIELASFSQQFRTGSNATEAFQISADQFDTTQFDDDGDEVSNLDELIAGSDPTIDEDSLLEIRDSFTITGHSVTVNLESLLSDERPISITTQEQISSSVSVDTDIQIDIDGNGTLTRNRNFSCEIDRLTGIRTRLDNAISWEANRIQNDCDFTLDVDLVNTVTIVDENTRTFEQELVGLRFGSFTNDWEDSTRLTSQLVDGTSMCKAVAGTHSSSFISRSDGIRVTTFFVSKERDDPYWRVEKEVTRIEFPSGTEERTLLETTEYFVRELNFGGALNFGGNLDPENPELFICDFVDI